MNFRTLPADADEDHPTYIYDLAILRRTCDHFVNLAIPDKRLYFATMANDHPAILGYVAKRGIGAFVNSQAHLNLALEAGIAAHDIVYASTSMSQAEFGRCFDLGVHVVIDSLGQLDQAMQLAPPRTALGVRVNVGSALDGGNLRDDPGYRFGITRVELAEALALARARNRRISGIHAYFGTNIMHADVLLNGLSRLGECVLAYPELEYIDVGGGFGIPDRSAEETFDYNAYVRGANELLARIAEARGAPVELRLEPGRAMVSRCGAFLVRVRDVKVRHDRTFVGTNASVTQFPRPLLHPDKADHPVELLGPRADADPHDRPIELSGSSTYSRDFLARGVTMPLPELDDRVLLLNAGAYGRSMWSRFLGKPDPREIVLADASPHDRG